MPLRDSLPGAEPSPSDPDARVTDPSTAPEGGAAGGGHASRPHRRRRLVWGSAAAVAVAVAAGAALLLARPASTSAPLALTSHTQSFAPQTYHGVVIGKVWRLSGRGSSTLTVRITASNSGDRPATIMFSEPIPAAVAADPQNVTYSPQPSAVSSADHVVEWTLNLPGHGSAVLIYRARISRPATRATLDRLTAGFRALQGREGVTLVPPTLKLLKSAPAALRLVAGQSRKLKLSGVLSDGTNATAAALAKARWKTSDPAVAVVRSGQVTARAAGTAKITAQIGSVIVTVIVRVSAAPNPAPTYTAVNPGPTYTPQPHPTGTPTPKL